jgi:hypothetical protein
MKSLSAVVLFAAVTTFSGCAAQEPAQLGQREDLAMSSPASGASARSEVEAAVTEDGARFSLASEGWWSQKVTFAAEDGHGFDQKNIGSTPVIVAFADVLPERSEVHDEDGVASRVQVAFRAPNRLGGGVRVLDATAHCMSDITSPRPFTLGMRCSLTHVVEQGASSKTWIVQLRYDDAGTLHELVLRASTGHGLAMGDDIFLRFAE